jgi:hypothetical protein
MIAYAQLECLGFLPTLQAGLALAWLRVAAGTGIAPPNAHAALLFVSAQEVLPTPPRPRPPPTTLPPDPRTHPPTHPPAHHAPPFSPSLDPNPQQIPKLLKPPEVDVEELKRRIRDPEASGAGGRQPRLATEGLCKRARRQGDRVGG